MCLSSDDHCMKTIEAGWCSVSSIMCLHVLHDCGIIYRWLELHVEFLFFGNILNRRFSLRDENPFWSSICGNQQASVHFILSADACSRPVKLRQIKSQWKIKEAWEYSTTEKQGEAETAIDWCGKKTQVALRDRARKILKTHLRKRVDKLISKQDSLSAFTLDETNAFATLHRANSLACVAGNLRLSFFWKRRLVWN